MRDDDCCYWSIGQLERAYADRSVSPVEVTEGYLKRISRLDGRVCSYLTVTGDRARASAEAAETRWFRRQPLGPMDGIPIGLKDLFDTAGVRTTAHSALFAERIPEVDATVVRRLDQAGAILLGKQAMHEFALGRPDPMAMFPPARNPWNTEMVPGGSSSGSAAALAAGLCAGALGSDSGGSIRWPAASCGIVGLKPTAGLVSRRGVVPLSWTLDHVGPMARTVEDVAILLQVVAGHDPGDWASVDVAIPDYRQRVRTTLSGVRVGIPLAHLEAEDVHPETLAGYQSALEVLRRLGADMRTVEFASIAAYSEIVSETIMLSEALAFHEPYAREHPERYGRLYSRLLEGALFTASDYVQAMRGRALLVSRMNSVMRSVDLLALPTMVRPAWRFSDENVVPPRVRGLLTHLFNLTGQPALSVPCGFTSDGLPIGLQIVGRPFADDLVIAAAFAYEHAAGWSERRPSL